MVQICSALKKGIRSSIIKSVSLAVENHIQSRMIFKISVRRINTRGRYRTETITGWLIRRQFMPQLSTGKFSKVNRIPSTLHYQYIRRKTIPLNQGNLSGSRSKSGLEWFFCFKSLSDAAQTHCVRSIESVPRTRLLRGSKRLIALNGEKSWKNCRWIGRIYRYPHFTWVTERAAQADLHLPWGRS